MTRPRRSADELDLLHRASTVLPGGTLGNVRLDEDYAFVVNHGLGSHIWDNSGNEYIDYLLGSGPMVVGHAHPRIIEAAQEALQKGATFFMQNEYAIRLAERVVDAVPCAEKVRFTSTGTEATYYALRVARAYRGRDKILKFEGGFHGMHDYSLMSLSPSGKTDFPLSEPSSAGIPSAIKETVIIAPYNDIDMTSELIGRYHNELAAVIVEPVQRTLAPIPGFLETLRSLTATYDIPLIFDEIVTGFRMAYGGAQEYYNVIPDLAAIGKIVGGGFPLAAVVGREYLMRVYDSSAVNPESFVPQIGTLNGNPVAANAGLATLDLMSKPGTYERYWEAGGRLRNGLQSMLDDAEIPATVSGIDLMFDVFFTEEPITTYRSTLTSDKARNRLFDSTLMQHGVFKSPGKIYVGICHDEDDIHRTLQAFQAGVEAIRG